MVVMVGGYASFPAGLSAVLTRVPLIAVNTDAVPGAANRLLGRFAVANAVAFDGTNLPLAQVTGTPVRPELHSLDRSTFGRAQGRARLGLPPDRQTIAAIGGSLGALRINRAVARLVRDWPRGEGRSVYHVTGRRDYDAFAVVESDGDPVTGKREGDGHGEGLCYRVVPYEERMDELYTAADVCIARAGAITVAELLVSGVPAILVPLPGAPDDHQTRNAEALARFGAAVVVPDSECDGPRLAHELDALFADPQRLRAMSDAALQHGHPDAARRVAELVEAHAR
jgi:UDP-N-acetylglucosamine:LPS N-acetylglucosamine transferase